MGLIARHIESPTRIFFYQPKGVYKDYVVLKITSKKTAIKPGELYEFSIPTAEGIKRYIGKVKHIIDDSVILTIVGEASAQRKFNRLVLNKLYIPVGIFVEKEEKPFVGVLRDFSLGGFRAKFSTKDFLKLKKLFSEGKGAPYTRAVFRIPSTKERYEVDVIPIRFNDEDLSVAFSYTFNEKNRNILKIYERLAEELEKNSE